ncbi:SAM-dependent methyltransferase, partial [Intestinibacillus massiliensis]|nr:SAM-dependent methyltransferase [Intestinibacillus massiliensis]
MKDKTLEYYEQHALEFCENTINADMSNQYKMFLAYIPQGGLILDLGCGSGRDTKAFQELGYDVAAMD